MRVTTSSLTRAYEYALSGYAVRHLSSSTASALRALDTIHTSRYTPAHTRQGLTLRFPNGSISFSVRKKPHPEPAVSPPSPSPSTPPLTASPPP